MPSLWPQIRWYALDVAALVVGLLFFSKSSWRVSLLDQPLSKPLLLFLAALGISLIFALPKLNLFQFVVAGSYWIRLVFLSLIYFTLRIFTKTEKKSIAFIAIAIYTLIALGQYLLFPDTRQLAWLGFDDHYYRLIGSFFDPNFTGVVMAAGVLIAIHHFHRWRKLTFIVPLIGLVLTFSRSSYLAFLAGMIFLVIKKRWWPFFGVIPILFALILAAPKPFGEGVNLTRVYSIESRARTQLNGLQLFFDNPIFGQGFNTLSLQQPHLSAKLTPNRGGVDNSFIYILAASGIVGFAAFLYFLWSLWQISAWTPPVQAVLLAFVVHAGFNNSFFYPWIYLLVMVLADYASGRVPQAQKLT